MAQMLVRVDEKMDSYLKTIHTVRTKGLYDNADYEYLRYLYRYVALSVLSQWEEDLC